MHLVNQGKTPVQLYKIDSRKQRRLAFSIPGGKTKKHRTRVGQAWEIRDTKGRCVWLLRPNRGKTFKVVMTPFLRKIAVPIKSIKRGKRVSRARRLSRYRRLSRKRRLSRASRSRRR